MKALVTRLLGKATGTDLKKFGYIYISKNLENTFNFYCTFLEGTTLSIVGKDAKFIQINDSDINPTTEIITQKNYSSYKVSAPNDGIIFFPKDAVVTYSDSSRFIYYNTDYSQFIYMKNITSLMGEFSHSDSTNIFSTDYTTNPVLKTIIFNGATIDTPLNLNLFPKLKRFLLYLSKTFYTVDLSEVIRHFAPGLIEVSLVNSSYYLYKSLEENIIRSGVTGTQFTIVVRNTLRLLGVHNTNTLTCVVNVQSNGYITITTNNNIIATYDGENWKNSNGEIYIP